MRAKAGSLDEINIGAEASGRVRGLSSVFGMWKIGILGIVATVITVGLVASGSDKGVVSAVGADVVSVSSGDWTSGSTWSTGTSPQPGQAVEVAAGHRVIFDANLTNAGIGKLDIFGTLDFSRDDHTVLESRGNIIVRDGGELLIGSVSNPLHPAITAKIVFDVASNANFVGGAFFEEEDTGLWVFNGGRWESHGAPVERPWTKLAATATPGSTSVIAEGDLSDWYIGGDVLITATGRNISESIGNTTFFTEDEERVVTALTPLSDGTTRVSLNAPLSYNHDGSPDDDDLRGEIALLTRNVQVTSKTNQRAHTIYMWGSMGAPSFTQFKQLGPRDVFSRYPLHFHLLAETAVGRELRGNVIWDSLNRFVVIHNSLGMTLESNIGYRTLRSGFWLEESHAGEMGPKPRANTLIRNLAVKVTSLNSSDRRVTAIHAQRENNYIDNVVVSMNGSTDAAGFIWQENEISSSGTAFVGNETHSSEAKGLFGWQNHGKFHIVDFAGWRNISGIKWGAYRNEVQVHGATLVGNSSSNFRSRNNRPFLQDSYLTGEADYPTKDGLFIDKYTLSPTSDNPARLIRNVFEDHTDYDLNHISKTTCGSRCVPTFYAIQDTELRSENNIRFGKDWETTNGFFDVQNYDGTVDGLPENFRLTRPDLAKPSSSSFKSSEFDAWLNPDHSQPAKWVSPPTLAWNQDYTGLNLSSGPVSLTATAGGFSGNRGEIEFFVDEFEDGKPWVVEYFPNQNLSGEPAAVLNQIDADFVWGRSNPLGVKNKDVSALQNLLPDANWSMRLTRTLRSAGGTYEYEYRANDGIRLYIDGKLVVDKWRTASICCRNEAFETINLPAGDHEVVVEFFHGSTDSASVRFDIHRVLTGATDTETFTFDAGDWDRKYVTIYARASDPASKMFAYSDVLRFRNPNFREAVPSAPGVIPPTPAPPAPTAVPEPTATFVPGPEPTVVPEPTAAPEPTAVPAATATPVVQGAPPAPPSGDRVVDGLLALYEFDEAGGSTAADTSGTGTPLDLEIQNSNNVTWIDGALRIDKSTIVASAATAEKISSAVEASDEISVEAWIRSTDPGLGGPARIVTVSSNPFSRNVTLGQHGKDFDVRLRASGTNFNGTPSTATKADVVDTSLTHVVYTRSVSGKATIYVDGVAVRTRTIGGDLNNWADDYKIALGNEFSGDRPWLGEFYLVALFDRALTSGEVQVNFESGSEIADEPAPEPTPTAIPEPTATPVPAATATAIPEPTATAIPQPTATPVPAATATPVPTATPEPVKILRVADLDAITQKFNSFWAVHLLIVVTDSDGEPVSNAAVSGRWQGATGATSCTTSSLGVCLLSTDGIPIATGAAMWETSNLSHPDREYVSELNIDPDGDSNGTTIIVSKP